MFSSSVILPAALALASPALASPALAALADPVTCPVDGPISCQNETVVEDTCCFNYPGGQVLLTQFWDAEPATGPEDAWTIHGLWPDNCDGTWEEFCDSDREYSNITAILEGADTSVLSYMEENWKDYQGDDESFWAHEWNKHGTCMSPLEPKCYPDFQPTDEVVDYFRKTVALHKTLPSYTWLEEAGIVPSSSATYTLAAIQAAIKKHHGFEVIVNCRSGELNEFWYHFNVQGSVQTGNYIPVPPVGSPSNCPKTGIKYLPKSSSGAPTTTRTTSTTTAGVTSTTTGSGPDPTGAPGVLDGSGRWMVSTGAAASGGFLVSGGTWYRGGGTPATYTATPDAQGGFSLRTSKGNCVIKTDASLFCDASVATGSSFGYDGTYLTYAGSNTFYASALPSGNTQGTVYTTSKAVSFKAAWTAL